MEFVFVVPREALFRECYPQGVLTFETGFSRAVFEDAVRAHGFFVERATAERTPTWKQVIPYTLVARGAEVLLLRRSARGGESRLHGKLSIGVGGHVNPIDAESGRDELLAACARREIDEELEVRGSYEIRSLGLLNDDSNPVGAVHLGLVQVATLHGSVQVREVDALEGSFVQAPELERLRASGANFETWSLLLLDRLSEFVPAVRTSSRAGAL